MQTGTEVPAIQRSLLVPSSGQFKGSKLHWVSGYYTGDGVVGQWQQQHCIVHWGHNLLILDYPENGGSNCLPNIGTHSHIYFYSCTEDGNLHQQCASFESHLLLQPMQDVKEAWTDIAIQCLVKYKSFHTYIFIRKHMYECYYRQLLREIISRQ